MTLRSTFFASLAALFIAGLPSPAEACSPPLPGVFGSTPPTGATYPSNAAIFLKGESISLTDYTVTLDGMPATLVPANLPKSTGDLAVRVEPAPAPGQLVKIDGTFCQSFDGCEPYSLTYTADLPDTASPEATKLNSFSVHDYVDFESSGGDCQSNSDLAYWFEVQSPLPGFDVSPVIYTLEAYRDAALTDPVFTITRFAPDDGSKQKLVRRMEISELDGKPLAEAFCFRVTTFDAAGNAGPDSTEVLCKPCHRRVEIPTGTTNFGAPEEPTWKSTDIYPGGPCDDGSAGQGGGGGDGSGGGESIGGCDCNIGADRNLGAPGLGGLALALGAIARFARRRRR